ncbi:MAG: MarR family transcriptional regulator [Sulfitobacter sp.]
MNETTYSTEEVFGFFTEIGIIHQLSIAILAKSLPDGVHPSHFGILKHLSRVGDGKSPMHIALAMQVTRNTMTHSLKTLQDRDYISVEPDPKDGRGKLVYLTTKGSIFLQEALALVDGRVKHLIGAEQIAIMRRIHSDLEQLRQHLDTNR